MSDIRARLADALCEHFDISVLGHRSIEEFVDAVLSLPGITIVELPEATQIGHGMTTYGTAKAMTADRFPGQVGRPGSLHWISPVEARDQAAALLAAAERLS